MTAVPRHTGHLIIGGGLAGSMLGLRLASEGRDVTLLEKERGPHHKVCGEFLSREAVDYLQGAGVDPIALGAVPLHIVRLAVRRTLVEANLPFPALSLSRHALDEAVLVPRRTCRLPHPARSSCRNPHHNSPRLGGSRPRRRTLERAHCLPRQRKARPARPRSRQRHTGRPRRLQDALETVLTANRRPARCNGSLPLHRRLRRLVAHRACPCEPLPCRQARASPQARRMGRPLLASILAEVPHLALRLNGAQQLWERPLAVSSIPYGYLAGRAGLWCVGDQAAVIPSFTGDGMSIALHSACLAARMFLANQSSQQYHTTLHRHLARNMGLSTTLSRLMVSGAGRALAPLALSLLPASLRWIANATRIPTVGLVDATNESLTGQQTARSLIQTDARTMTSFRITGRIRRL